MLSTEIRNKTWEFRGLFESARLAYRMGEIPLGDATTEQAEELAEQHPDRRTTSRIRHLHALRALAHGDPETARRIIEDEDAQLAALGLGPTGLARHPFGTLRKRLAEQPADPAG